MKRLFFEILLSFCPLFCVAANFEDLTDEDAGVLLYYYNKATVLVFGKCVTGANDAKLWECTQFRGNRVYRVRPDSCTILNYTEAELTPEIVAIELAYWTCQKDNNRIAWYRQIAEKMNEPATNELLAFYAALKGHVNSLKREIDEYRKAVSEAARNRDKQTASSNAPNSQHQGSSSSDGTGSLDVLEEGLKAVIQNADLVDQFQGIAKNKKNFFLALCMYFRYREVTANAVRGVNSDILKALLNEIDRQGEVIRQEFQQARANNQNRENNFKTLCRDKHGRWEYAPPADMNAVRLFVTSCHKAWRKTLTLSPHSEFPDWGNAMLEVLQMIQYPELEKKFDDAYFEYQKNNSN